MKINQHLELSEQIKILNEAQHLHNYLRKQLSGKAHIQAMNIALIALAAESIHRLPAEEKLDMQERFLKSYCKAADAPFTFYKLGYSGRYDDESQNHNGTRG